MPVIKIIETETISLRLAGRPLTPGISAAFYQAEEESLEVPIIYDNPRPRFFSALDSESLSLQCDNSGRLIFVHVKKPRRLWLGEGGISHVPSPPADIRFLDFRSRIGEPEFLCDAKKSKLLLRFAPVHSSSSYQVGDNVFLYMSAGSKLTGLYIDLVNQDRAGKKLADWKRLVAEGSSLKPPKE
ncbi:MAG: hypothetical protein ACE5GA_07455 [Candidatus Zixiibacteriota bacterium]